MHRRRVLEGIGVRDSVLCSVGVGVGSFAEKNTQAKQRILTKLGRVWWKVLCHRALDTLEQLVWTVVTSYREGLKQLNLGGEVKKEKTDGK